MWRPRAPFCNQDCAVALEIAIFVVDAPPLITLAAAQALDYLLLPELPVIIPDAVFHEATSAADKLGAHEILDWYRAHTNQVRIEPTEIFDQEMLLREALPNRKPPRDLGERAAIEIVRTYKLDDDARALLLSDDRDEERLLAIEPQKAILLTTWDYLRQLEVAGRIQSADEVMESVRSTGRNPPLRDLWSGHAPEIRDAVRAVIEGVRRGGNKAPQRR
jgi:hypothetical protein